MTLVCKSGNYTRERGMDIRFYSLLAGLGLPNIYHNSGVIYKKVGILLGGCLTVKNYWELLTGDDLVGFRGLFIHIFSIHFNHVSFECIKSRQMVVDFKPRYPLFKEYMSVWSKYFRVIEGANI